MKRGSVLILMAALLLSCSQNRENKIIKEFETISAEIKSQYAPDSRSAIFESQLSFNEEGAVLKGATTNPEAKSALVLKLIEKKIEFIDSLLVYPHPNLEGKNYGVTRESVINFRTGPGYSRESATQTVMGTPLQILEKRGGWTRAVTPEGYIAWVSSGSIEPMTQEQFEEWRDGAKVIVTSHYTLFRESPNATAAVVSDGVWGNIVREMGRVGSYYKVLLPNGKEAYLNSSDGEPFERWLASRNPTAENIIATAKEFLGFPYMWGGTSIKAIDCSGFTKTVFYLNGVITLRDASQQAKTGVDVEITESFDKLLPGDLLFFGSKATAERGERITHVGIYLADGEFIHSATSVRINSLIPEAYNYYEGSNRLVRVNRFIGEIDRDPNILSIKNHPWYISNN